jgi:hypothetical protein
MTKKELTNKLTAENIIGRNETSNYNAFYVDVIDDVNTYAEEVIEDTSNIPNSIFEDFLTYHEENGTYRLMDNQESLDYFEQYSLDILDVYCMATYPLDSLTLPVSKSAKWWTPQALILGAVRIVVADIQKQLFPDAEPIDLPFGMRV